MTISIKPTASGSTIEQDGSTVLSIESDRSVDIDSGTLHVDATNNRVGIGTSSPSVPLDVNGVVRAVSAYSLSYSGVLGSTSPFGAGTISTDSNWGMYFKATTGAAQADFAWVSGAGTERMRISSAGTLFLGQTSNPATGSMVVKVPTGTGNGINFQATGAALSFAGGFYNNTGGLAGYISFSTTTTAYNTSSDYRLKENVAPMSGSIDRLKQLKPSTWSWVQDGSHGEGFLAHEAQTVVPECATGTKDEVDDEGNPEYQGIDQSKLVPLLTAALQEAITKIEDLETRIQALENT